MLAVSVVIASVCRHISTHLLDIESRLERCTDRRRVEYCRRAQAKVLVVKFDAKSLDISKE